jgi:hypothetical protein
LARGGAHLWHGRPMHANVLPFPDLKKRADIIARFEAKIEKLGNGRGCWIWRGAKRNKEGYGAFRYLGAVEYAHRVSVVLFKPKWRRLGIPDDLVVMHLCDNPECVRPSHLKPGTASENQQYRFKENKVYGRTFGGATKALAPVIHIAA